VSRRGFTFELGASLAGAVVPFVLGGLGATLSVTRINVELLRRARGGTSFIGVLWHEDLPFWGTLFRGSGFTVLVSRSRDGEIGTRVAHRLGVRTVRGSSSRGGEEALQEIVDRLRAGGSVGFIADGPRGPRHELKIGPVVAAKVSGRPIVPIACAMRGFVRARSWDRTRVPLPFARVVAIGGDPVPVPAGASRDECERLRARIQDEMLRLEGVAARRL